MIAAVFSFAGVMQQNCQVEQEWPLECMEQRRVSAIRRFLGIPDPIELLETNQRVFVSRVLMVKLMLNQARQLAEFRDIRSQKVHFMHRAKDRRDVPPLIENGQES